MNSDPNEEKIKALLKSAYSNPPRPPPDEYARIDERIAGIRPHHAWYSYFVPALAFAACLVLAVVHFTKKDPVLLASDSVNPVPTVLLLYDPTLDADEFRSPTDDWNALAEAVTAKY